MKIPLHLKLRKKAHKDVAYAQDLLIEDIYKFFPKAVLHGGTAIWRCYSGNRFSEDVDMYLPNKRQIDEFFKNLEKKGFVIIKKRIKQNSLYSVLDFNRVNIRFEAVFAEKSGVLMEYETVDGNLINVYTLPPNTLLNEKISAFFMRKKIRDLYDIFFLLRFIKEKKNIPVKKIKDIIVIDEENLKTIIISGLIPTSMEMKRYIEEWAK